MSKPKIRFKGYTDEWEQRKLGDVTEFNPKSVLPKVFEYVDLESVVGTEMVSHRTEKLETAPSRAQRLAEKGDVFFQTVRPYQRNNYLYEKPDKNYVFSTGYAQMRPHIEATFLMSFLQTDEFVKIVLDNCTGTSYPAINATDLANLEITLPKIRDEQKRIGQCIMNLDHLITLHQRKCEETKKLKKYMLQKMFPQNGMKTPEIRFEGFTDAWEQRKLGDIADIVGGGTPSTSKEAYWDGEIDWYTPAEITNQIYLDSSERKITKEGFNNSSAKMLPIGTVVFTSRAGIGKMAILRKESCTNQGFQSIVPHEKELDSYFIFSRSKELKRYAETVGAGSTFVEVSGKQMAAMELMMPPIIEEQRQIGEYFEKVDHLITLHQRKCDELQNIKKFMLQNMFV